MEQEKKGISKLACWIFGFITGGAIAAPITAFAVKKVCDKKMEEAVQKASYDSYQRGEDAGMNTMAEYAISQQAAGQESVVESPTDQAEEQHIPSEDEINNYDLRIDDEEATEAVSERFAAHEQYLDMVERYRDDVSIVPRMIDAEKFEMEHFMEKSYVNWYEQDNVFEENLMVIQDPFMTFGVTDGKELFRDSALREDPDIAYVRNEKCSTDFEITRIHGSYEKMVRDEVGINGQTDT